MIKLKSAFIGAAVLAICCTTSHAADNPTWPAIHGHWCQTDETGEASNEWTFFVRGNCQGTARSLFINKDGSYVQVTSVEFNERERCKPVPKTLFKGWVNYRCTDDHEPGSYIRHQKWLAYDGQPERLGRSVLP
jgi:hypothetical protein